VVQFSDASIGTDLVYAWDFDNDGNVDSNEQNPSYTYDTAGTYSVNLTVTNAGGSDSEVKEGYIVVSEPEPPVADFTVTPTSGVAPLTVQFTDASSGIVSSWQWDFDNDGTVDSTEQSPSHTYESAGNYTVTLAVSNAGGSDSEVKADYISVTEAPQKPVAEFSANVTDGSAPLDISFTDQSTGSPDTWEWSFGDGTSATEQNPVHTYSKAGKYTVSLTVKNELGRDRVRKSNYIIVSSSTSLPVADFDATPTSGNTPLEVSFTDNSTGSPTSWRWSFGDGKSSRKQNPVHTYTKAGNYTVSLTVRNADGSNTTTKSDYITVSSFLPVAAFSASPESGSVPLKVKFTDQSTGSPTSYKWSFGDGTYSTSRNPVHTYKKAGTYRVSLKVKNEAGSSIETMSTIVVSKNK
jgi:PKD repeat protein